MTVGESHLFPGENVLVEVELDLLVGDVDAKLLEGVLLEVLKTKDVQDANVQTLIFFPGDEREKSGLGRHVFNGIKILLVP